VLPGRQPKACIEDTALKTGHLEEEHQEAEVGELRQQDLIVRRVIEHVSNANRAERHERNALWQAESAATDTRRR